MDIVSYLLGKNAGGGGGGSVPQTISKMNEETINFINWFNNEIKTIPNTYEALTDESVTLYTPNIDYTNYAIQKRDSNKYRVVWFPTPARMLNNSTIFPPDFRSSRSINFTGEAINSFQALNMNIGVNPGKVYYSEELDTIEICIEKMKKNELTYTQIQNSLAYKPDTPVRIPISNTGLYYIDTVTYTNDEFVIPKKISSNENFTAI